ncbi:hypothetical protein K1719_032348 [Acacia pycnantha]|nr:hypothetical protein K1719_032348 [Acacia pycnantha]
MKPSSSSSFPNLFSLLLSFAATFTISFGKVVIFDGLKDYHEIKLPNVTDPESLAFDCNGEGSYVGVSDGRILKWKGSTHKDAYFGLLMVGPSGGVAKQLAISTDDDSSPFKFLNGLDVDDQTGVVYFSDSSTVYQRREGRMISQNGDKTGRLLKYEPSSKKVEILLQGLEFANGVALNKDGSFLLIAETDSGKIHKFWLEGSKTYTSELYAKLERPPDNIKRNKNGDFWVALYSNRTTSSVQTQKLGEDPVGVKLDLKRKILEILDGRGGPELEFVSEVQEHHGRLWIGSSVNSYVAVIKV